MSKLSVLITSKVVQDPALSVPRVEHGVWILGGGNLKEPIQPTQGYQCGVGSCGLPRKNAICFVPLSCERVAGSGCTCV